MGLFLIGILLWVVFAMVMAALFGDIGAKIGIAGPPALLFLALVIFTVVAVSKGWTDLWGNVKPGSPLHEPPQPIRRPPTDRQLNFIDELIRERDVDADDRSLHKDPETIEEASATITHLLSLPYREHHDDS